MGLRIASAALIAGIASAVFFHPRSAVAQEWFDDYQRGVEALEEGRPDRAVQYLARAVRKRPEPGVNVVTYGTNRLREYYPLLKLAEAQLLSGDLDTAGETLRRSQELGVEPSDARARLEARYGEEMERAKAPGPEVPPVTPPTPVVEPPRPSLSQEAPPPVVPETGTLVVRSAPDSGASVLADNRLLGVTPLEVELDSGEYEISILKEGSRPERIPIRVEAGKTNIVTHQLVPVVPQPPRPQPVTTPLPAKPAPATLLVVSVPSNASAYLDDELKGSTDPETGRLRLSDLSPGRHRIRLTLPEHEDLVDELELEPGRETRYHAPLTKQAPASAVRPTLPPAAAAAAPPEGASGMRFLLIGLALALVGLLFGVRRGNKTRNTDSEDSTLTASDWTTAASERAETRISAEASRFGEFRLLRPLGRGGMATVYLAERNGDHFALKRPSSELLDEPEFRERFLREASIGRTLHHPNIIRIFEQGEVDGIPYFTMELIDGDTLRAKLDRGEARGSSEASAIVLQIAEALDYAHLKGVVHRDLKPGNIMITKSGTCKVMDYGIARARRFEGLTVTGAFLGTPNYIAPETAEGRPVDARSDLYALGIIFYEMLTGQRPFDSDNPLVTLKRHCTEPPTPPSLITPAVPRRLEAMVLRLLAKSPDDRHADAEQLLVELRDFVNQGA